MVLIYLFAYQQDELKSFFLEIFSEKFPEHNFVVYTKKNLKSFFAELRDKKPDFVVLLWDFHPSPTFVVEEYYRKTVVANPLIVAVSSFKTGHLVFLNEYNIKEHAKVNDFYRKECYFDIFSLLEKMLIKKDGKLLFRQYEVLFFTLVRNKNFEKAIKLYQFLAPKCSITDQAFYKAFLLYKKGLFDEAIVSATRAIQEGSNVKYVSLLALILYRKKEYANALRFLSSAKNTSPAHIKTLVLLSKTLEHLEHYQQAIDVLIDIKRECPIYKLINEKIVNMIYSHAESVVQLTSLDSYVDTIPDRGLIRLYIRTKHKKSELKRYFLDAVIRQFSIRANKYIEEYDYSGALKCYKHIEKIIDTEDQQKYVRFLFCVARVYYKLDNFENSQVYNQKSLQLSNFKYDKAIGLNRLLEKSLRKAS